MSDNQVIPDAAVEAAHKAWREQAAMDGSIFEYNLRAALEAAAPHMLPRTITTVEDLDALPVGSVVLDRLDICYRLYSDHAHKEPVWCVVGEASPSRPHGWLPVTILHEGVAK